MKNQISLTTKKIDIGSEYKKLIDPANGAICAFVGTVREMNYKKKVTNLYFEAYKAMALHQMEVLANAAREKWPLNNVVMVHALGIKEITAPVVFIGTASAHRDAAFQASRYLIEKLKETVPIWKKETYHDHSTWINAHP